jgi:hypothetical protein
MKRQLCDAVGNNSRSKNSFSSPLNICVHLRLKTPAGSQPLWLGHPVGFGLGVSTSRQSGDAGVSFSDLRGPVSQSFPVESIVMNSPVVKS